MAEQFVIRFVAFIPGPIHDLTFFSLAAAH